MNPEVVEIHLNYKNLIKISGGNTRIKSIYKIDNLSEYKIYSQKQLFSDLKYLKKINKLYFRNSYLLKIGKNLFFILDNDNVLYMHFGMTGFLSLMKTKYSKFFFTFYNDKKIFYNTIRNFGKFKIITKDIFLDKINKIGDDIMLLDSNKFIELFKHNKKKKYHLLKYLMDQKHFSGIGNYIKNEVLYDCKIFNPDIYIKDLNIIKIKKLFLSIKKIIDLSLKNNGCTIKDFKNLDGSKGNYQNLFRIYNKKQIKGNEVIKMKFKDNRTTHCIKKYIII